MLAAPTSPSQVCATLRNAQVQSAPFQHCVAQSLLDPLLLAALREALSRVEWEFASSSFYKQRVAQNLRQAVCGSIAEVLFDAQFIAQIANEMGLLFSTTFNVSRTAISLHNLRPGHMVGPHTDCPRLNGETETHRLLLYILPDRETLKGGELILFDPEDVEGSARIIEPANNLAVGIELSAASWHAVNEVESGDRYALAYSFWRADTIRMHHIAETVNPSIVADLDKAKEVLHGFSLYSQSHAGGRSLEDHLIGTADVLDRWGCGLDTCLVGLFHAVKGTGSLPIPISAEAANQVRSYVGESVYARIIEYSQLDISSLTRAATARTSETADSAVGPLLSVFWANELDQTPFSRTDAGRRQALISLYKCSRFRLSHRQQNDIENILGFRNLAGGVDANHGDTPRA